MIEKIKKDFYYENFWEQFQSSDYFKFFGYTRHSSFKRFLDNEKYYEHIWCESWSKINTRERNTISFDRELFVKLCQLKNILVQEVEQIAVEYYSSQFKKRILNFRVRTKADIGSPLQMYNVPMGKYYTYSLNTYNMAKDLLLCPYDVFKFFNEESHSIRFIKAGLTNEFKADAIKIPFLSCDHTYYASRYEFLLALKLIIKKYKMSEVSKKLAAVYYGYIKEMLDEQTKIDQLKKEKYNKIKREKEKKAFNPSANVKDMYRKACKLYHPDKNPKGEEIFKIINKAYQEGDVSILKKYSTIL